MSANSRLTTATHILAWLQANQQAGSEVATSEQIANSVNTNPVVVRRLLGELRDAGLVEARRGAGAGWWLTREPESVTLLEIHEALDDGPLFGMHRATPNQKCPVGYGIRSAMGDVYAGIENAVRTELKKTTLTDVLRETLAVR